MFPGKCSTMFRKSFYTAAVYEKDEYVTASKTCRLTHAEAVFTGLIRVCFMRTDDERINGFY